MTKPHDSQDYATSVEKATVEVQLLVVNRDSRSRIRRWIGEQPGYETVDPVEADAFDICFFDWEGFDRYAPALTAAKSEAAPASLPFVLVVPETEERSESIPDWSAVEREFGELVDDVITAPVRDLDLARTVNNALCLRSEPEQGDYSEPTSVTFREIIDAMDQAVYVTDVDGVIEFVNPAFTEITGYEPHEARGKTAAILNSGQQDEAYYRRLWETVSSGAVWSERIVNERKSGERYHAKQTIVPVTDGNDEGSGYVAIQTDITERTNQTRHMKVIDRILRHNLSNDLNVIEGRAELIKAAAPDDLAAHAERILETAENLVETAAKERAVVRHLVREETPLRLNVATEARQAAETVRQSYPEATIQVATDPETYATVSPKLEEAIEELLVNAIVHNDTAEPTVHLTVSDEADAVEITVADNGPGIPENERDVLRRCTPPDQLFHGRGLGLWLVRWIVSFSRGTISVEENGSQGATVRVRLTESDQRPKLLTPSDMD